jgi:predicted  nucleic acid-binding Zn-ribbon protein
MTPGWNRIAGTVGFSLALSLGATPAFADNDDDPTAYLYSGTCADFASATVVDEINDLDTNDDDVAEIWERISNGQDQPDGFLATEDDVDDVDTVQAVADGEYFVAVHQVEDTSSAVMVCGDLSGTVEDDTLLASLEEVDGSGFEGRVLVHVDMVNNDGDDRDDDDVEFSVGTYPAGSVEPLVTPTPAG